MKKTIKASMKIAKITDYSKKDKNEKKEEIIIEARTVVLKNELFSITYTTNKQFSELKDLDKITDIGLPVQVVLKVGENPQKSLQEFSTEEK